jgi:hypothetical protein
MFCTVKIARKTAVLWIRIGFNANPDPDPASYLNADPDPGSQTNADPEPNSDPGQTLNYQKIECNMDNILKEGNR